MESFWVIDAYVHQKGDKVSKRGIISSAMVDKALAITCSAHRNQIDRTGRPSLLRAIHVAEQMQGELPVCAALLADVISTGVTFEDLRDAGFPHKTISLVRILAQDSSVPFLEHIQGIKDSGNSLAVNIALTRLMYDCNLSKFRQVDEQVVEWYAQCMQAMAILESGTKVDRWKDGDMQFIYNAITTRMLDIKSDAPSIGGRLSNLAARPFVFCGIQCGSVEGVLQSFKFSAPDEQVAICQLHGSQAKRAGKDQDWKTAQTLYWRGEAYPRESQAYQQLLDSLYKAAFDQNERFRENLALSKGYALLHSIGSDDPKQTILTQDEFISRLEWLRDMLGEVT